MKHADNIEETIKNELNFSAGAEMRNRILGDVLEAHENSKKEKSSSTPSNLRRQIMKSPITKLAAAAAIIIAVSVVINPFGNSATSVAWAEIAERFESVPFFNLTIYNSYDTSAEAMKIEIWKSENSRVRAHQGNNVIFADFANGKEDFIAFDRTTKQPVDDGGLFLIKVILNDLCPEGRFSLNTLINSFPSDANGFTPVQTADTAASRETVVFEARHNTTPEWISIWALRGSKLPIQLRFRDPRSNEFSDAFFDYSVKKDDAFFDPNAFINEVQEQVTQPSSENFFNEQELIDVFRGWTVLSGGAFPSSLGLNAIKDIDPNADTSFRYNSSNTYNGAIHFETPYATLDRDNPPPQEEIDKFFNNVIFVLTGRVQEVLAKTTDWHYAGKGVKLGDVDTAILWYRLKGSETYRVIYGDLSAKDIKPENLSK